MSEADALLLVEHHFGQPDQVQAMLRDVHGNENPLPLGRRVAALCLAWAVTFAAAELVLIYGSWVLARALRWYGLSSDGDRVLTGVIFWLAQPAVMTLAIGAFWWKMRQWWSQVTTNPASWLWRTPTWVIWLPAALAMIVYACIPLFIGATSPPQSSHTNAAMLSGALTHQLDFTPNLQFSTYNALALSVFCAMGWTCLHWIGVRSRRSIVLGILIVTAFVVVPSFRPFWWMGCVVRRDAPLVHRDHLAWAVTFCPPRILLTETIRQMFSACAAISSFFVFDWLRRAIASRRMISAKLADL